MMYHPTTEDLIDYDRRELDGEADARVHEHLRGCAACARHHEDETSLVDILRKRLADEERDLPSAVSLGVWERISGGSPSSERVAWWNSLRPLIALPMAAMLLLAVLFGTHLVHIGLPGQHRPGIDVATYIRDHAALARTTPFGDQNAVPVELADESLSLGSNVRP